MAESPIDALKRRVLTSTVVVERVDESGQIVRPRGLKRVASRLNQALVESGRAAPWMLSREECQAFWTSRQGDDNSPEAYAQKSTEIVDFMADFWSPEVAPTDEVLEIGCNAGTNLEVLRRRGFERLSGIEINPRALEELRRAYSELGSSAQLIESDIETALAGMPDASFDVVFSMAVLIHLHPSSTRVFADMARVARYVLLLELESTANSYVFPRAYRRVFERLGCTELRRAEITPHGYPGINREYDGYVARLFRTPAG